MSSFWNTLIKDFHMKIVWRFSYQVFKRLDIPTLRVSSVNVIKSAISCSLVTFTQEILHRKRHFLCAKLKVFRTLSNITVNIYLLKVNNRNTRTGCWISSKLTSCSSVSIVNFWTCHYRLGSMMQLLRKIVNRQ